MQRYAGADRHCDVHRLSTIRDSDLMAAMDHDEIMESGGHETLPAKKGKYSELYMTRYAGFAT